MPEVVHWNPRKRLAPSGPLRKLRRVTRVNNFGDLLGPLIVQRMAERIGLPPNAAGPARLLAIGSILHLSRAGDTVWGSGVNGKIEQASYPSLDVRAVRGPLTARVLRRSGLSVPNVYGDPALLLPLLWTPDELHIEPGTRGVVYVPNLHDMGAFPSSSLDPRGDPLSKVRHIASAELVVASSLHGIIVAEAFGVPVAAVASPSEPALKYEDYFEGTGRRMPTFAKSWRDVSGSSQSVPLSWNSSPLVESFPADLWSVR
jgi:pyruvyltransferase